MIGFYDTPSLQDNLPICRHMLNDLNILKVLLEDLHGPLDFQQYFGRFFRKKGIRKYAQGTGIKRMYFVRDKHLKERMCLYFLMTSNELVLFVRSTIYKVQ